MFWEKRNRVNQHDHYRNYNSWNYKIQISFFFCISLVDFCNNLLRSLLLYLNMKNILKGFFIIHFQSVNSIWHTNCDNMNDENYRFFAYRSETFLCWIISHILHNFHLEDVLLHHLLYHLVGITGYFVFPIL